MHRVSISQSYRLDNYTWWCWGAGRFGFQRDMRAISSLWEPESEDNLNVRALLESTAEVVDRAKIYARWWRLWRADVRAGWVAFGRYKASHCAGHAPDNLA